MGDVRIYSGFMSEKIMKFEIPVPADEALLQAYLDLGWYRLPGIFDEPDYLKWSFAKGSPRHPGDKSEA